MQEGECLTEKALPPDKRKKKNAHEDSWDAWHFGLGQKPGINRKKCKKKV